MVTENVEDNVVAKIAEIEQMVEGVKGTDAVEPPAPPPASPPLKDPDAVAEKYRAAGYEAKPAPGKLGGVTLSKPSHQIQRGLYYTSGQRSVFGTPDPENPAPTQFPDVMPDSTAADGPSLGVKRHDPPSEQELNERFRLGDCGGVFAGFTALNNADLSSTHGLPDDLTPLERKLYVLALSEQGDVERQKLFAAGGVKACKQAALERMREMISELQPKKKPWYKFW